MPGTPGTVSRLAITTDVPRWQDEAAPGVRLDDTLVRATLAAATAAEQERQWDAFSASLGVAPSAPAPSRPPATAYAASTPPSEAAWDAFSASLGLR